MDPSSGISAQLQNIEKKTDKTLDELTGLVRGYGPLKHMEIVAKLKAELGLGHGDANTLAHTANKSRGEDLAAGKSEADLAAEIYLGPKEALRPIHDRLMKEIQALGEFEIAPKKGYFSLRCKKQFATIGPGTNSRLDVGLNMKGIPATARLLEEKPGSMCQYKVKLTEVAQVDPELIAWLKTAYEAAR